jgi:Ser-tRNA(Ala) deacylase AlaX
VDRLWITDPTRVTCLAKVTKVRRNEFCVDKALFAPRSTACRHPQNHDKGTVWLDGEKRRLSTVREAGDVWYSLRGTIPAVGQELQCQLDQETRQEASRAHTAMHLVMQHIDAPMIADAEVKGGGHFRLTYAWPIEIENAMKLALAQVKADVVIERTYATRAAEKFVTKQQFSPPDPVPGPEVLPLVKIGEYCIPCDGSHADRTGRITNIQVRHAAMGKAGFVISCRVT